MTFGAAILTKEQIIWRSNKNNQLNDILFVFKEKIRDIQWYSVI